MQELFYIELAHRLNTEYQDRMFRAGLHFRGNLGSLALVSLHKNTPELGYSGIRTKRKALELLDRFEQNTLAAPRRPTREKELQAWLIRNALANDHRLFFDGRLRFITSELALKEDGKRVVNDMLALDEQDGLVIIELKSSRDKTRIEAQVEAFMRIIDQNRAFFHALTRTLTGREWSGATSGLVVWNAGKGAGRKISAGYREFCYDEVVENGRRCIAYDTNGNVQFHELL